MASLGPVGPVGPIRCITAPTSRGDWCGRVSPATPGAVHQRTVNGFRAWEGPRGPSSLARGLIKHAFPAFLEKSGKIRDTNVLFSQ